MGVDDFLVWSGLVRFAWFYTKTKPIEDWIAWGCCRITKPNLLRSLDFAVSLRRSLHWLYVGESELRHESGLMALVNKGLLWSGQHVSNPFTCCTWMYWMCRPIRGSNSLYFWSSRCSLSKVPSGPGTRQTYNCVTALCHVSYPLLFFPARLSYKRCIH